MLLHHAPTQYPARAARQWIPPSILPSIPPERSVDPAEYPTRAARHAQWIPPSLRVSQSSSPADRVSRQSSSPVVFLPEQPAASGSRRVSSRSGSPAFASGSASIPPEQLASLVLLTVPSGAQLGLHFMLAPSCFECALRLGKGDAFVLLWVVNKQLCLIPRRVSFWKGLGFC